MGCSLAHVHHIPIFCFYFVIGIWGLKILPKDPAAKQKIAEFLIASYDSCVCFEGLSVGLQPSGCTSSSSSEVPVPKPRRRLSVGQVDETELPGNQDGGMKGDEGR